jgi:hypothetical protein
MGVRTHTTGNRATSVDEDTSFALSLLPTLRFLREGNKLQARIKILSILQKFKF